MKRTGRVSMCARWIASTRARTSTTSTPTIASTATPVSPVCPVDAIYADYETPREHDEYIHKNYEYFGLTAPAALFKRS